MFSLRNAAISWSSKKQATFALPNIEAEYRGAVVANCEVIWLKRLLRDLYVTVTKPIPIYCNNLNSIQVAKNPVFHACTKHIEVHYHFVREHILCGKVDLHFV